MRASAGAWRALRGGRDPPHPAAQSPGVACACGLPLVRGARFEAGVILRTRRR